eukprot:scaffold25822_cov88-Phaeocystis_antarctica.AAC.1
MPLYGINYATLLIAPLAIAQTSLAQLLPRYYRATRDHATRHAFNHQHKLLAEDHSLTHIAAPFACCRAPQFARDRRWP